MEIPFRSGVALVCGLGRRGLLFLPHSVTELRRVACPWAVTGYVLLSFLFFSRLCCVVFCSWLFVFVAVMCWQVLFICCSVGSCFVSRKMKLVEVRSGSWLLLISNLFFPDLRSNYFMFWFICVVSPDVARKSLVRSRSVLTVVVFNPTVRTVSSVTVVP
jgi:hypothetical protein